MGLRIPIGYASIRMDFLRSTETDLKSIVFGVETDGFTGITDDIVTAFSLANSFRSILNPLLTLVSVTAYGGNDGPLVLDSWSGSLAGTAAGADLCSPAVSYVVKKRTGFVGQRNRGRMMLPFAEEAFVSSAGVVTPARVTAITTAMEVFRAALPAQTNVGPQGMVVLHDEALGTGEVPTPVTSLECRGTVGTVRRRQIIG